MQRESVGNRAIGNAYRNECREFSLRCLLSVIGPDGTDDRLIDCSCRNERIYLSVRAVFFGLRGVLAAFLAFFRLASYAAHPSGGGRTNNAVPIALSNCRGAFSAGSRFDLVVI